MDIAVLADIHGNYIALDKCIKYAEKRNIDTFLFLGDYVGELAYPEKAMDRLYAIKEKYNCIFIRGNKEEYWIDYRKNGNENWGWEDYNSTTGMLFYAYNHLSKKDIDFFEALPIKQRIEFEGHPPFLICHGSPYWVNEKMIPNSDRIFEIMESSETGLIICGHTHIQNKTIHNGKTTLNPGSVGMPLLSEGETQFLILHSHEKGWQEEFVSLEYEVDEVIEDMRKDNLMLHAPYWSYITERVLRNGRISNAQVLDKAMALCREDVGECVWPHIPERYWEQAVKELYTE